MVRPIIGFGLVGVSLFMLLGFLNADLAMPAAQKFLTFLIAVGIPGAAGGTVLVQHFGGGKKLARSKEELIRKTQEAELLRLAGENDSKLTIVEVVRELAVTHPEAEELLKSLVVRGYAEVEVTDSGMLVYSFPDVQLLGEKSTSRGVLDD